MNPPKQFIEIKDFKNLVAGENSIFAFFGKWAITECRVYVKKSRNLFENDTFQDNVRAWQEEKEIHSEKFEQPADKVTRFYVHAST